MGSFKRNSGFRGGDSREDRQMFRTTCGECGNDCEVPFRPSRDKPVYCHRCFKKDSSPRGEERREDRQMFRATCGECGDNCEVPFRPSGDKPVYCSNCFGKGDRPGKIEGFKKRDDYGNREKSGSDGKLLEIASKLDKIITLLEGAKPAKKVATVKKKAVTEKAVVKKKAAKKVK